MTRLDRIVQRKPDNHDALYSKSNALAWLADSQRLQGHLTEAAATRQVQKQLLSDVIAGDPRNINFQADMLAHDLAVARIEMMEGATARALTHLDAGRARAEALLSGS